MKTDYESPPEHSSSPDGCRKDERLHEVPKPYPGPFWFDAEDGTICFRDEHQTICGLADIPDYDDPIQAATAAHIVLCVNSHDRLVKLVSDLRDYIEDLRGPRAIELRRQVNEALAATQPKP